MKAEILPTPSPTLHGISVVMVSYHTGPVLWRSVESVLRQEHLHELIIVDNGNPPSIQQRLKSLAATNSSVTYIGGHGNIGFAKACNKGAAKAEGHYLLLLNPDCILPPDTLKRTQERFIQQPEAWMAGCRLVNPDYTEQGSCRRNVLTLQTALAESLPLHRILPKYPRLNFYPPDASGFVPTISGAFMFMQRETYLKLGGMDEGYFLHVEDVDFCLQLQKHGGKILYIPDITVIHFHRTSEASSFFVERQKARGFIRYFQKHFSSNLPLLYTAVYARLAVKSLHHVTAFPHNRKDLLAQRRVALLESHSQLEPPGNPMPVLLTGATGQVGLCVLRRLLAANTNVTAVYRSTVVDFTHPALSWLYADLKHGSLHPEGTVPETVIHTAALWLLPKHIKALAQAGVTRIIAFSSTSVLSKAYSRNPYDKALAERLDKAEQAVASLCEGHGIAWTILRPTLVYGVGLDKNVTRIANIIKNFKCFPVYGIGRGRRKPVHADDLAQAALSIISNPSTYGKKYALCGGETLAYYDMVERIFYALGKTPTIIKTHHLPRLLDYYARLSGRKDINGETARRMESDLVFDDSDARQDFGYNPRRFLMNGWEDIEPGFDMR